MFLSSQLENSSDFYALDWDMGHTTFPVCSPCMSSTRNAGFLGKKGHKYFIFVAQIQYWSQKQKQALLDWEMCFSQEQRQRNTGLWDPPLPAPLNSTVPCTFPDPLSALKFGISVAGMQLNKFAVYCLQSKYHFKLPSFLIRREKMLKILFCIYSIGCEAFWCARQTTGWKLMTFH